MPTDVSMYSFEVLLYFLYQQTTDLAQVHHDGLVDLLPQVGTEDLDERDLEGGDLSVHEDAGQVQLHLTIHDKHDNDNDDHPRPR